MSNEIKQVIIIRRDLKMRAGKTVAQGAHASVGATLTSLGANRVVTEVWSINGATKIGLCVDTEDELIKLKDIADSAGLVAHIVLDEGVTEFHGKPTITALAIGPDYSDKIDKITKDSGVNVRLY